MTQTKRALQRTLEAALRRKHSALEGQRLAAQRWAWKVADADAEVRRARAALERAGG